MELDCYRMDWYLGYRSKLSSIVVDYSTEQYKSSVVSFPSHKIDPKTPPDSRICYCIRCIKF